MDPSLENLAAALEAHRSDGCTATRALSASSQEEAPMRALNDDVR